jgi:hypothetical protein
MKRKAAVPDAGAAPAAAAAAATAAAEPVEGDQLSKVVYIG